MGVNLHYSLYVNYKYKTFNTTFFMFFYVIVTNAASFLNVKCKYLKNSISHIQIKCKKKK